MSGGWICELCGHQNSATDPSNVCGRYPDCKGTVHPPMRTSSRRVRDRGTPAWMQDTRCDGCQRMMDVCECVDREAERRTMLP